jgi:hypothetical protein
MTKSNHKRTEPSTQPLLRTLRAEEMKTWNAEKVLQWIQQRSGNILRGDEVDNFKRADITGSAFLLSSFEFFKSCALSPGTSLVLTSLVDEVKGGKFMP